jgi:hypothetical protein
MALAPGAATGSTLVEPRLHLLAAMGQFPCPDDLARRVVDHRYAGHVAAWIKLEPQRRRLRVCDRPLQYDGEGVTALDGDLAFREKPPRPRWVTRRQRTLLSVHHKNHDCIPVGSLRLRGSCRTRQ